MAIIKDEVVEEEHHVSADTEPPPPSFAGRLNLASFTFSPVLKPKSEFPALAPRRSPRIAVPPPTSNPQDTKRKSAIASPSPSKKLRTRSSPSKYAPPSQYAHLSPLRDVLAPNLICLFIGLNPGIATSVQGHAYAHPSNLFWKLLYSSGCTPRLCHYSEDGDLPRLFDLGNTNIVDRPTRNGAELSKQEMDDSVEVLEEKIRKCRPESVCLVGKSIWESVWRAKKGRKIKKEEFRYGWQDEGENMGAEEGEWKGAKVFVASSTSGLAATLLPAEKERIWRELGVWVEKRRMERAAEEVKEEL